jgi:Arm DNA-binding domain
MVKLSARKVETLKSPGHCVDGDGLALVIGRCGGKFWVLRAMVRGKRCDIGLGGVSWVSLAGARENSRAARQIAREGGDPFAARRGSVACPTFEEAARKVHAEPIVGQAKNGYRRSAPAVGKTKKPRRTWSRSAPFFRQGGSPAL